MEPTYNQQPRQAGAPTPNILPAPLLTPDMAPVAQAVPEQAPLPAQIAPTAAAPVAAIPMPIAAPTLPVMPAANPSSSQAGMPTMADDSDLIEKEWVVKAKQIVHQTKEDPYTQSRELNKVRAEYIKKRYNKDVKLPE